MAIFLSLRVVEVKSCCVGNDEAGIVSIVKVEVNEIVRRSVLALAFHSMNGQGRIYGPGKIKSQGEVREKETTHVSNANFLGCGCSGAPYGTTISASDRR